MLVTISLVQTPNRTDSDRRLVNPIRNSSFPGCCSFGCAITSVECYCLLHLSRTDTHPDARTLSLCSEEMSWFRPTRVAARPLNRKCHHLSWREGNIFLISECLYRELIFLMKKCKPNLPFSSSFSSSTSMLLAMNLLLLLAHFPFISLDTIKLLRLPICASSASLNVPTPDPSLRLHLAFGGCTSKSE